MSAIHTDSHGVVQRCPDCGQKNRVAYERLGETGRCGRCGAALLPPAAAVDVRGEADFQALISRSPVPVLIDFWAPWCAPCRMVAPEVEKVAASARGRYIVAKVNTQEQQSLAARHRIASIPALAVFLGGQEITRSLGARPAEGIQRLLQPYLIGAV